MVWESLRYFEKRLEWSINDGWCLRVIFVGLYFSSSLISIYLVGHHSPKPPQHLPLLTQFPLILLDSIHSKVSNLVFFWLYRFKFSTYQTLPACMMNSPKIHLNTKNSQREISFPKKLNYKLKNIYSVVEFLLSNWAKGSKRQQQTKRPTREGKKERRE